MPVAEKALTKRALKLRKARWRHPWQAEASSRYQRHPKPPYSYVGMMVCAISSAPEQQLTLAGIHKALQGMFPFFRGDYLGWKDSVRHNLSHNKCFVKILKNPNNKYAKGNLWKVEASLLPEDVYKRQDTAASLASNAHCKFQPDLRAELALPVAIFPEPPLRGASSSEEEEERAMAALSQCAGLPLPHAIAQAEERMRQIIAYNIHSLPATSSPLQNACPQTSLRPSSVSPTSSETSTRSSASSGATDTRYLPGNMLIQEALQYQGLQSCSFEAPPIGSSASPPGTQQNCHPYFIKPESTSPAMSRGSFEATSSDCSASPPATQQNCHPYFIKPESTSPAMSRGSFEATSSGSSSSPPGTQQNCHPYFIKPESTSPAMSRDSFEATSSGSSSSPPATQQNCHPYFIKPESTSPAMSRGSFEATSSGSSPSPPGTQQNCHPYFIKPESTSPAMSSSSSSAHSDNSSQNPLRSQSTSPVIDVCSISTDPQHGATAAAALNYASNTDRRRAPHVEPLNFSMDDILRAEERAWKSEQHDLPSCYGFEPVYASSPVRGYSHPSYQSPLLAADCASSCHPFAAPIPVVPRVPPTGGYCNYWASSIASEQGYYQQQPNASTTTPPAGYFSNCGMSGLASQQGYIY